MICKFPFGATLTVSINKRSVLLDFYYIESETRQVIQRNAMITSICGPSARACVVSDDFLVRKRTRKCASRIQLDGQEDLENDDVHLNKTNMSQTNIHCTLTVSLCATAQAATGRGERHSL